MMETFWKTIGLYNLSTWIYQLIIIFAGFALTALLIWKPGKRSTAAMKVYLVILYLWIAIVYFWIYCAERSYNNVMTIFWLVLSLAWIWDLATGYTVFKFDKSHAKLAGLLLLMPFLYPAASLARGFGFPEMISPIMPCSAVVFTFGIMLMFSRKINLFIVLLLCHWSMIGLSKTYFFNLPEDYIMTCASVPAVYFFFKEYFLRGINTITKPQAKYMELFLLTICIAVCVILAVTMCIEVAKGI